MAPTTIKKASGEKVKTGRKDAMLLAHTLSTDGYKSVYIPEEENESTKELTRASECHKETSDESKAESPAIPVTTE